MSEEEAEVQVGMMRVRARRSDLDTRLPEQQPAKANRMQPAAKEKEPAKKQAVREAADSLPQSPGVELDLRGSRVEEALDDLDRHLDSAFLAGLPWVRIIHGKGTGRLRDAVRESLDHHPQIKSHKPGLPGEGGDGVTVAYLRV